MIVFGGHVGINLLTQGFGGLQTRAADADSMETIVLSADENRREFFLDENRRELIMDDNRRTLE